jgi:nucleotide-binding universal stress UspA family protein
VEPAGRPDRPAPAAGTGAADLLVLCDRSDASLWAAEYAVRTAADLGCGVTVALLLTRPSTLAWSPLHVDVDDAGAELDAVIVLSYLLDPYGVRWQLEPVTHDPVRAIAALACRHRTRWLVVARRGLIAGRRTGRVAGAVARRCGLPVLVVTEDG